MHKLFKEIIDNNKCPCCSKKLSNRKTKTEQCSKRISCPKSCFKLKMFGDEVFNCSIKTNKYFIAYSSYVNEITINVYNKYLENIYYKEDFNLKIILTSDQMFEDFLILK